MSDLEWTIFETLSESPFAVSTFKCDGVVYFLLRRYHHWISDRQTLATELDQNMRRLGVAGT